MQNQAIDIHHHYVPKQLIEETKRHGKALGVDITEDKGSHALSFAGSKPHRLQPALMDVERRIEIMDEGQVGLRPWKPIQTALATGSPASMGKLGADFTTTACTI